MTNKLTRYPMAHRRRAIVLVAIMTLYASQSCVFDDTKTTLCADGDFRCPTGTQCAANQLACIRDDCGNGVVDRTELSRRLTLDPSGFGRLEAVVHPLVRKGIAEFLDRAEAEGHVAAAVEVPLLFESGHDYGFDAIAVTHVDDAIQRQRVLARPGMTVEKLESLLARQMPQAEKKGRATWLFDTAQSRATIETQVADLVAELRRQAQ